MIGSKFNDLKEEIKEALSQFWLDLFVIKQETIHRIKVDKNDKASLTPTVLMHSPLQICTKTQAEMVFR